MKQPAPQDTQPRSRLIIGEDGPSDSALAAARGWRLRRAAAARCASRALCSGGAPWRYSPSKALKTGLGAERLQLKTAARLFAAVAIMSVVALRLVGLREQVRCIPDHPAEAAGLEPLELEVLRAAGAGPLRTVRDVALAIGRLGGHLNRRQDGLPGWQTLWLGMKKLALLVEGVRLARQTNRFG